MKAISYLAAAAGTATDSSYGSGGGGTGADNSRSGFGGSAPGVFPPTSQVLGLAAKVHVATVGADQVSKVPTKSILKGGSSEAAAAAAAAAPTARGCWGVSGAGGSTNTNGYGDCREGDAGKKAVRFSAVNEEQRHPDDEAAEVLASHERYLADAAHGAQQAQAAAQHAHALAQAQGQTEEEQGGPRRRPRGARGRRNRGRRSKRGITLSTTGGTAAAGFR